MNTLAKILITVVALMVGWWLLKVAFKVGVVIIAAAVAISGARAIWGWLTRR